MSRKIMGFQSRKVAAFLAGLLTGILIGGCCSVFGPGVGVSVYGGVADAKRASRRDEKSQSKDPTGRDGRPKRA